MGQKLSKKTPKPLRSFRYKTPHGNFVIIVEESETDTIGNPSLSTCSENISESIQSNKSSTLTESLDPSQNPSSHERSHQTQLPKSVSQSIQPTKSQSPSFYGNTSTQPSKKDNSLYSTQSLSRDTITQSSRHTKKTLYEGLPFKKTNDRLLFKVEYLVSDPDIENEPKVNQDSNQWKLYQLPNSDQNGNKAFLLSKKRSQPESEGYSRSSLNQTSEDTLRNENYKTKKDLEEEMATLSLNSKRVGPHCETCQCEYGTDHRKIISHQDTENQLQSDCCFGLPQEECHTIPNNPSTSSASDSDSKETWKTTPPPKPKKPFGKKINHCVTVATMETKFKKGFPKIFEQARPELTDSDYLPERIPKKLTPIQSESSEYVPQKLPRREESSSEYIPEKIPKRHEPKESESSVYLPEKIPRRLIDKKSSEYFCDNIQNKPQSSLIDSESSEYFSKKIPVETESSEYFSRLSQSRPIESESSVYYPRPSSEKIPQLKPIDSESSEYYSEHMPKTEASRSITSHSSEYHSDRQQQLTPKDSEASNKSQSRPIIESESSEYYSEHISKMQPIIHSEYYSQPSSKDSEYFPRRPSENIPNKPPLHPIESESSEYYIPRKQPIDSLSLDYHSDRNQQPNSKDSEASEHVPWRPCRTVSNKPIESDSSEYCSQHIPKRQSINSYSEYHSEKIREPNPKESETSEYYPRLPPETVPIKPIESESSEYYSEHITKKQPINSYSSEYHSEKIQQPSPKDSEHYPRLSRENAPIKAESRPMESESSEYYSEHVIPKQQPSSSINSHSDKNKPSPKQSEASEYSGHIQSIDSDKTIDSRSKSITSKHLETILGIVLPNQPQSSYQLTTCDDFKKALKEPVESMISRDIMDEACRLVKKQPTTSDIVPIETVPSNSIKPTQTQPEIKRSYMDEYILTNCPRQAEQVLLSIQSASPNPLIVTLLQPMGPNELGHGTQPLAKIRSKLSGKKSIPIKSSSHAGSKLGSKSIIPKLEENHLSKQLIPLKQSEQVFLSITTTTHKPLAVTLIPPNKLTSISQQPLQIISQQPLQIISPTESNQSEEIPLEQSKLLKQPSKQSNEEKTMEPCETLSTKLVALLETKYNKKFNTIEELMAKPPRDVMLVMLTGEVPNLPVIINPSKGVAIQYDDFLSSMKSGV